MNSPFLKISARRNFVNLSKHGKFPHQIFLHDVTTTQTPAMLSRGARSTKTAEKDARAATEDSATTLNPRSALVSAGRMRTAGTSAAALSTDGNATKVIAQTPAMPTRGARLTKIVEKDVRAATEDSASKYK